MVKKKTGTYIVEATREGRWWVLTVEALGIAGQMRQLYDAAGVARSLISAFLDVKEKSVQVEVRLPSSESDEQARGRV